jgi:flagellar basal body-associated protein FliL
MAKEGSPPTPEAHAGPSSKTSFPLIPLLNVVVLLATVGFYIYSKFLFKRPPITEEGERDRLAETHATPTPLSQSGLVNFDPITVNISPAPVQPQPADGPAKQIQGKLHYVTIGLAIEIRDQNQKGIIDALRPFILDHLITILGKKKFNELTSVHGRYLLHSQIIEGANHLITSKANIRFKEELVTNVFFTQFVVQ